MAGNDKAKLLEIIKAAPVFDSEVQENNKDNIIKQLEKTVHDKTINPAQDYKDGIVINESFNLMTLMLKRL